MSANIPPHPGYQSQLKDLQSALEGYRTREGATPRTNNEEVRAACKEEGRTRVHERKL
ncbi:hypothetical protein K523DRAFT_358213 [Schizophyllum commune Tattone D]|nr:hypothetical protein K523DRAFT_358213 [Schizophyllum commune Tattone D]